LTNLNIVKRIESVSTFRYNESIEIETKIELKDTKEKTLKKYITFLKKEIDESFGI